MDIFSGSEIMINNIESLFNENKPVLNFQTRDYYLTKTFTLSQFKKVQKSQSISNLIHFQRKNKLLFMAYNEPVMRKMGQLTANPKHLSLEEIINKYEKYLNQIFQKYPTPGSNINVLIHAFGHISNNLSTEEKQFFLNIIEKYRNDIISLSIPKNILYSWITKFDNDYLIDQTFFNPYPEELVKLFL